MNGNYEALTTEPGQRRALQVTYSVRMVADIAVGYDSAIDRGEMILVRCMIDAFYVHVRLLAEFLLRKTGARDFGPNDFGINWVAPASDSAKRLDAVWDVASAYVVHFGGPRVPETLEELRAFEISGAHFRRLAEDALDCYSTFVDAVSAAAPEWSAGALIPDPERQPELWEARIKHDVVAELRRGQAEAKSALEG